jgi:hypothetical protein
VRRRAAIEDPGFSPRRSRFLAIVLLRAGVFVERQYCTFAKIQHGHWSVDLTARLLHLGLVREVQPGARHRDGLIRLHIKRRYRLVGEPDAIMRPMRGTLTIRVLVPAQFDSAIPAHCRAAREELRSPLGSRVSATLTLLPASLSARP